MDDVVHGWGFRHTPDDHDDGGDGDDGGGGGGGGGDDGGGDDGGDYDHHVWDVAIYLFWIFNCAVHAHVEAPFKKHLTSS